MSLINQVLNDIEQRQASLHIEDENIKAKLQPALGVIEDDWQLPPWLKPFLILCVLVALIYHLFPSLSNVSLSNFNLKKQTSSVAKTGVNISDEAQNHYLLTKTLSSDWQALVNEKDNLTKPKDKNTLKQTDVASDTVSSKITKKAENNDTASGETNAVNHNPAASKNALQSIMAAIPLLPTKQDGAGDANVNFTSSVTPAVGVEVVQVLKQMKPEQEANQHLQRAMDMHQKGNINEAIDATRKALVLAPDSEEARLLLSGYLVESRQPQEATQVLQSGLQLQPKQLGLRKALAKLQLAEGQQDKALETLQQGADQAPRDGDYSAFWALTLQKANKHSAAVPLFEQALRTNSSQVQWLVGYAVSLQAEGRTQEALKQFQEAQNLPATERLSMFIQQRIQELQNP